jgi:hypothetical protein
LSDGDELDDGMALSVPSHVLSRQAGDETVLLDLDTEEYYGLEGVGVRVWELVEAETTVGRLVSALLDEYDVDEGALRADLTALLGDLRGRGMVVVDEP